jgi:hypothetical protein
MTCEQIASRFGVSRITILHRLKRLGIQKRAYTELALSPYEIGTCQKVLTGRSDFSFDF